MEPKIETTFFADSFWSELVGQRTSSSAYSSVMIAKTISLNLFFFFFLVPQQPKFSMTLKFQLPTTNLCSLYFHVPPSLLILDSIVTIIIKLDIQHPTLTTISSRVQAFNSVLSLFILASYEPIFPIRQFVALTVCPNV